MFDTHTTTTKRGFICCGSGCGSGLGGGTGLGGRTDLGI